MLCLHCRSTHVIQETNTTAVVGARHLQCSRGPPKLCNLPWQGARSLHEASADAICNSITVEFVSTSQRFLEQDCTILAVDTPCTSTIFLDHGESSAKTQTSNQAQTLLPNESQSKETSQWCGHICYCSVTSCPEKACIHTYTHALRWHQMA